MKLFHCFGAKPEHRVDTQTAVEMLNASHCAYLAVNTHNLADVSRPEDLPIGYASATMGSVLSHGGLAHGPVPVLNINHPTSADEAVDRTRRAVSLTGIQTIKLEVLDHSLTTSNNDEVLAAAQILLDDDLDVWPLISPNVDVFQKCQSMGSSMVRVMGSPIGARRGIDHQNMGTMREILRLSDTELMLDGGIGSHDDVVMAEQLGFDSILVNSWLFNDPRGPITALTDLRVTLNRQVAAPMPTATAWHG